MPHKARLSVPGAVTHVMARCLDGLCLLIDKEDGRFFVDTMPRHLNDTGCRCYAWALMTNHYHVVFRRRHRRTIVQGGVHHICATILDACSTMYKGSEHSRYFSAAVLPSGVTTACSTVCTDGGLRSNRRATGESFAATN